MHDDSQQERTIRCAKDLEQQASKYEQYFGKQSGLAWWCRHNARRAWADARRLAPTPPPPRRGALFPRKLGKKSSTDSDPPPEV